MSNFKKRANGKGCAAFLGKGRQKPWGAKLTIGKDINGKAIYHFIGTFETELGALVCLENYHKEPEPIYINEDKYNKIVTFPVVPYPIVPVQDPHKIIVDKVKAENYTFNQLFELFKEDVLLTKEEQQLEKIYHIRPKNKKYGRHYCRGMTTAYHNSTELYDRVYKDLRASDFTNIVKNSGKSVDSQRQMINLYIHLDSYALEKDIIQKGYAQFISTNTSKRKEIKTDKNKSAKKERLFEYKQIDYLWNMNLRNNGLQKEKKQEREQFIRDFWLMLLYSGTRADELLSIYTDNIFLDDDYFIGGLKTEAGINRQIPIHPDVKHLYEKYYNTNNEFLFMQPNGKKIDYDYYLYHYKFNFKKLHPEVSEHTAHDARHMLRNELRKLGVKDIIINSIIGHSNEDVGNDVYSHISIKEKIEAIKMVKYKEQSKILILKTS